MEVHRTARTFPGWLLPTERDCGGGRANGWPIRCSVPERGYEDGPMKRRRNRQPMLATRRADAFAQAIRAALEDMEAFGIPVTPAAVAARARYPAGHEHAGKLVSRTTLYARRPDGQYVHQDLLLEIDAVARRQAAEAGREDRPPSQAEMRRDLDRARADNAALAARLMSQEAALARANEETMRWEKEAVRAMEEHLITLLAIKSATAATSVLHDDIRNLLDELGLAGEVRRLVRSAVRRARDYGLPARLRETRA